MIYANLAIDWLKGAVSARIFLNARRTYPPAVAPHSWSARRRAARWPAIQLLTFQAVAFNDCVVVMA